ncbi:MAG: hypothetical protein JNK47_10950 [Mesorhizobium sp.]|nr:hypothetical protein [Mesorhizobium sp.]MBL8577736.1 hypothetical protein [Mesorhizobium sp.]
MRALLNRILKAHGHNWREYQVAKASIRIVRGECYMTTPLGLRRLYTRHHVEAVARARRNIFGGV